MASRFWRLRLAILFSAIRVSPLALVARVVSAIAITVGTVALAAVPFFQGQRDVEVSATDIVLTSVLGVAAMCIPLFQTDQTLQARQFAAFPLSPGQIFRGLSATTLLNWAGLWLLLWVVVTSWLRVSAGAPVVSSALAAILTVFFLVTCVRFGGALGELLITPRTRSFSRVLAWVLLCAAIPVLCVLVAQTVFSNGSAMTEDAARILAWSPFGAATAGAGAFAAGSTGFGLGYFGISVVSSAVLYLLGQAVTYRALNNVPRPSDPGYARSGLGWFERFPARPWGVIAARSLTYWLRDPRYGVGLIAVPIAPVLVFIVLLVAGVDQRVLVLVPLPIMLLLLGWSGHNDVAVDSTALWQHVASGTRGISDRVGRMVPIIAIGLPLIVVGSSFSVTVLGDWRILPAVIGVNSAVLLCSVGVSSVCSALFPYPTTRPGESPFSQPAHTGIGASAGVAQSVSIVSLIVILLPVCWLGFEAIHDVTFHANIIAMVVGVLYGLALAVSGIRYGGKIFDRSAPELLSIAQSYD